MCWSITLYPGQHTVLLTSHMTNFYQSERQISDIDQSIDNMRNYSIISI